MGRDDEISRYECMSHVYVCGRYLLRYLVCDTSCGIWYWVDM